MKIFVNGKPDELDEAMTIARLLERRKARPEMVSVEVNDRILQREEYAKTLLQEGDAVEILYFMGGGREAHNPPLNPSLAKGETTPQPPFIKGEGGI